jgi:hypothetical protein
MTRNGSFRITGRRSSYSHGWTTTLTSPSSSSSSRNWIPLAVPGRCRQTISPAISMRVPSAISSSVAVVA